VTGRKHKNGLSPSHGVTTGPHSPAWSSPAKLCVCAGHPVERWLAVDSQVARSIQGRQLVLQGIWGGGTRAHCAAEQGDTITLAATRLQHRTSNIYRLLPTSNPRQAACSPRRLLRTGNDQASTPQASTTARPARPGESLTQPAGSCLCAAAPPPPTLCTLTDTTPSLMSMPRLTLVCHTWMSEVSLCSPSSSVQGSTLMSPCGGCGQYKAGQGETSCGSRISFSQVMKPGQSQERSSAQQEAAHMRGRITPRVSEVHLFLLLQMCSSSSFKCSLALQVPAVCGKQAAVARATAETQPPCTRKVLEKGSAEAQAPVHTTGT
jgi:hypothetical protein